MANKSKYDQRRRNELAREQGYRSYADKRNQLAKAKGFKSAADQTRRNSSHKKWVKFFDEAKQRSVQLAGLQGVNFEDLVNDDMDDFWDIFRSEYKKSQGN